MKKIFFVTVLIITMIVIAVLLPQSPHQSMGSYGEAQIGGPFTLTDTHGARISNTAFSGRFMLVYMGYSHCPDICPATLSMLGDALKKLGPDAGKVAVLFISLDPAHDTPPVLAAYLKAFDPRIIGLTGSEAEIKNVTKEYKAYAAPADATPGSLLITHSGILYLMGMDGKYLKHFESGVGSDIVAQALKEQF
jgi:cytochrome oxidase Cu insertion factor (SCO1/SenC/PrrC family)